MGLDMYMFHVERLNDEEVLSLHGKHTQDIDRKYTYISKEDFDADPDMYSDLIPFVSQISVKTRSFDWRRCWKANGVAEDDDVCASMFGGGIARYTFNSGKSIELSHEEYEDYCYDHETMIYAWKSKQVAYWRKYYDLDEYLQQIRIKCRAEAMKADGQTPKKEDIATWQTENCGYYLLSFKEKQLLGEFLKKNAEEMHCDDYEPEWFNFINDQEVPIFYHAWW